MAVRRLRRGAFTRIRRRIRYFYLRLVLVPDRSYHVARGLAAGVFVGMLPVIPFQTVVAVFLAWLLRGSKFAGAAGTWITNPLTISPFYAIFYILGRAITPFGHITGLPASMNIDILLNIGGDVFLAMLFGGLAMGVILAPLTYWLTFRYIDRLNLWEREKVRQRRALATTNTG